MSVKQRDMKQCNLYVQGCKIQYVDWVMKRKERKKRRERVRLGKREKEKEVKVEMYSQTQMFTTR